MDLIDRAELKKNYPISSNGFGLVVNDDLHKILDSAQKVDAVPMSVIKEIEKALIENVDRIENDDLRIAVAVFTSKALDDIREIVKEYTDAK